MLSLLKQEKKSKIFFTLLFMFISAFDGVVLSYIVSQAGKFSNKSTNLDVIQFGIIGLLSLFLVYFSQYMYTVCVASIIKGFNIYLKHNFFWSQFYPSKKKSRTPETAEIISNLSNDFKLIENQYFQGIFGLISNIALCFVSLIYMLYLNIYVSLLFLSLSFLPMIIPFIFSKKLQQAGNNWSKANEGYINEAKDYLQGFSVLRTYSIYKEIFQRNYKGIQKLETQNFKLVKTQAFAEFASEFCAGISFIVPFIIGCLIIINTQLLSFSSLIAIFLLNDRVVGPLSSIASGINKIETTKELRKKLFITNNQLNLPNTSNTIQESDDKLQDLIFDKLRFSMGNGNTLNINQIFTAPFKVLIYGRSATGKSTLLKLIKGELIPDSGHILAKNTLNKPLTLSQNTAYISQTPYIFNTTLFENLTLFQNNKFKKENVLAVLKQVGLYDELGKQNSLDYQCGIMGENLSGGQMQRIEIARALLQNKKLLLVDEATANLDNKNSKLIRDLLFELPIPFIEVAHHYDINDMRYTAKYELKMGKLINS